jgi:hypothetical protein
MDRFSADSNLACWPCHPIVGSALSNSHQLFWLVLSMETVCWVGGLYSWTPANSMQSHLLPTSMVVVNSISIQNMLPNLQYGWVMVRRENLSWKLAGRAWKSHCYVISQQCGIERIRYCHCAVFPCLENRHDVLLPPQGCWESCMLCSDTRVLNRSSSQSAQEGRILAAIGEVRVAEAEDSGPATWREGIGLHFEAPLLPLGDWRRLTCTLC